jgi:diguanylate cyclase (GGDEF)-like protein
MRIVRAAQGAIVSLGAPVGWYLFCLLDWGGCGCDDVTVSLYLAFSSILAFTGFGFLMGSREDESLHLSLMDHITGIYNARYLHARLHQEYSVMARTNQPMALVILDLDHFKSVNDTYGHPAGDTVLHEVAQAIWASVRKGDTVARVGGEEFAVLLPNSDSTTAKFVSERIRLHVRELQIPMPDGQDISVTISGGVACSADFPLLNADELYKKADQALFLAKDEGRDRIVRAKHDSGSTHWPTLPLQPTPPREQP